MEEFDVQIPEHSHSIPGHTHFIKEHKHTVNPHSHDVEGHKLTISEMPTHNHRAMDQSGRVAGLWKSDASAGTAWSIYSFSMPSGGQYLNIDNAGNGASHNHGATSSEYPDTQAVTLNTEVTSQETALNEEQSISIPQRSVEDSSLSIDVKDEYIICYAWLRVA